MIAATRIRTASAPVPPRDPGTPSKAAGRGSDATGDRLRHGLLRRHDLACRHGRIPIGRIVISKSVPPFLTQMLVPAPPASKKNASSPTPLTGVTVMPLVVVAFARS